MAPVPLERPDLPQIDTPLRWPGRVAAVFGPGALPFATAIADAAGGVVVRADLRHAPGFKVEGRRIFTHPSCVLEALEKARPAASPVVGVGPVFALAVRARPLIWLTGGQHVIALPAALRELARGAHLALETPRGGLAEALARRL